MITTTNQPKKLTGYQRYQQWLKDPNKKMPNQHHGMMSNDNGCSPGDMQSGDY